MKYDFIDRFYDIMTLLSSVFDGWCACGLFSVFVEPKMKARGAKYGFIVFWTVCNMICYYVFENGGSDLVLLGKLIIYTLVTVLFAVLWYKGGILQKLLPALIFAAVRELVVQFSNCFTGINGLVVDILWYFTDDQPLLQLEIFPTVTYASLIFTMLLITVMRCFMIYRSLKSIEKSCRFKPQQGKEAALYLLPSVLGLMVSAILRMILITIDSDGYTHVIYERYPSMYFIIPIMSAMLLAVIVYSFKLYQDMTGLRQDQADKAVLESQLENMQYALSEKERAYESFNAVRHDMKNSLAALRGLISRKCPDDDEVNRYFESMSLSFERTESRVSTGSAVCDTIIGSKFGAAESEIQGIRLDADGFVFPENISADPYDMGIILSNGLDNAIEACRRLKEKTPDAQPFITVRSFRRKNMFFAEIENSFDGAVRIDETSGLPVSSKNGSLHGIGLRNVKNCAEKYSGGIDFMTSANTFTLSVMIKAR